MQQDREIRGGDQGGLRAYNRRMIMTLIRQAGALPKSEIARATGLTAQSASVIVNELLAEGLVRKGKKVRGRVGQPTTPISLDPNGASAIGVKIGRRSLELALIDLCGTVVLRDEVAYDAPRHGAVMEALDTRLDVLLDAADRDRLTGIGIAAPGHLSEWGDVMGLDRAELAAWHGAENIAHHVTARTGVPTETWNDATAACAAEMQLGTAMTEPNVLYIYVGTFVGGGLVIENRLFEGAHGNAAAIGSMPVTNAAGERVQLLRCASLIDLARRLTPAPAGTAATLRETVLHARDNPAYAAWRAEAASALAQAIAASASVIDFDLAVVDSMLAPEDVADLVTAVRAAHARLDLTGTTPVAIVPGTIGPDARVRGAAILPFVRNYSPDRQLLLKRPTVTATQTVAVG